jgi:hypothetical protein
MDVHYLSEEEFELKRQVLRLDPYEAKLVQHFLNKNKEMERVIII